jgi:hypothetical protein
MCCTKSQRIGQFFTADGVAHVVDRAVGRAGITATARCTRSDTQL